MRLRTTHIFLILVALYCATLVGARIKEWPSLFAFFLVAGLPVSALLSPRATLQALLISAAVNPTAIFYSSTAYTGIRPGASETILQIGGIALSFNAVVATSLLLTSFFAFVAIANKTRGIKNLALPFVPFIVISAVVWATRFPTLQGFRTLALVVAPVVAASVVYSSVRTRAHVRGIERAIFFSIPLSLLIAFALAALGLRPLWAEPAAWDVTEVFRFTGADVPPAVAWLCIPGIALALGAASIGQRNAWKWVGFFVIIISATVTRGAVLTAVILTLWTVLNIRRTRVIGALATVGIAVVVGLLFWQALSARVVAGSYRRVDLWSAYVQEALQKPWLGHGFGADVARHEEIASSRMLVPHNDYIRLWFSAGLIGLGAYVYALMTLGIRCWNSRRKGAAGGYRWASLMALFGLALQATLSNPIGSAMLMTLILSIVALCLRSHAIGVMSESPSTEPRARLSSGDLQQESSSA